MSNSMISTVTCPSCGKAIEVTEALVHQIQDELTHNLEKKHKQDLDAVRKQTEISLKKELEEKSGLELSDLKKQLEEKDRKVREMREEELRLREQKRKMEEREKDIDIEIARKIDEERKKVEEAVLRQTQDAYRLKDLEKEKVIQDLRKSLEDAQRKAQQGSQQTQGEVAELDFEHTLSASFPSDTISAIEKGVRGADIRHVVRTPIGNTCGVILWEIKRTKAWSQEWVSKLKEDVRSEKAHIPVIVTSVLPEQAHSGFGFVDGVYVVSHVLAVSIAAVLRQRLIDVAYEKYKAQNKEGSAEKLYEYVTGHEFRQHVEAVVEVFYDMQQQLTKEKAAYEKIWKMREAHAQKLLTSTSGIVGAIQGRIGQSLPAIKGLDLLDELEVANDLPEESNTVADTKQEMLL